MLGLPIGLLRSIRGGLTRFIMAFEAGSFEFR